MYRFIPLAIIAVLVVVGSLTNFQINPKTDGTIKTQFTLNEILVAVAIFVGVSGWYLMGILKRIRGAQQYKDLENQHAKELSEMTAPVRSPSIEEYRAEGQAIQQGLKDIREQQGQASPNGRTTISAFAGSAQYMWDGETLSEFSSSPLYKFDGTHISAFAGKRSYSWDNGVLSEFAGSPIYKVSGNQISEFSGAVRFRFDSKGISEFAGSPLYSINGEIEVPAAIVVMIAAGLV